MSASHWRDSSKTVCFFGGIDAVCLVPLFISIPAKSAFLFGVAVVMGVVLYVLKSFGITYQIIFRYIRRKIHGDYRFSYITLRTFRRRARW